MDGISIISNLHQIYLIKMKFSYKIFVIDFFINNFIISILLKYFYH